MSNLKMPTGDPGAFQKFVDEVLSCTEVVLQLLGGPRIELLEDEESAALAQLVEAVPVMVNELIGVAMVVAEIEQQEDAKAAGQLIVAEAGRLGLSVVQ